MRADLLGLELTRALDILRAEGKEPRVTVTTAPRREPGDGVKRVVYASSDGMRLTVAPFVQPPLQRAD